MGLESLTQLPLARVTWALAWSAAEQLQQHSTEQSSFVATAGTLGRGRARTKACCSMCSMSFWTVIRWRRTQTTPRTITRHLASRGRWASVRAPSCGSGRGTPTCLKRWSPASSTAWHTKAMGHLVRKSLAHGYRASAGHVPARSPGQRAQPPPQPDPAKWDPVTGLRYRRFRLQPVF